MSHYFHCSILGKVRLLEGASYKLSRANYDRTVIMQSVGRSYINFTNRTGKVTHRKKIGDCTSYVRNFDGEYIYNISLDSPELLKVKKSFDCFIGDMRLILGSPLTELCLNQEDTILVLSEISDILSLKTVQKVYGRTHLDTASKLSDSILALRHEYSDMIKLDKENERY